MSLAMQSPITSSDSKKPHWLCKICTCLIISQVPPRRDFIYVTLVYEDGQHLAAHCVILAATSYSLRIILIKNSHHHPLL